MNIVCVYGRSSPRKTEGDTPRQENGALASKTGDRLSTLNERETVSPEKVASSKFSLWNILYGYHTAYIDIFTVSILHCVYTSRPKCPTDTHFTFQTKDKRIRCFAKLC